MRRLKILMDTNEFNKAFSEYNKVVEQMISTADLSSSFALMKKSLGEYSTPEIEQMLDETADLSKQLSKKMIKVFDAVNAQFTAKISAESVGEEIPRFYRVDISKDLIKAETEKSYLIELPRQVVDTKENSIWFSKKFTTDKRNGDIECRFYSDKKYTMVYYVLGQSEENKEVHKRISEKEISAETLADHFWRYNFLFRHKVDLPDSSYSNEKEIEKTSDKEVKKAYKVGL